MRVIFVGASSFGLKCLNAIARLTEVSIVGVITNPKTFSISYSAQPITNVLHADFQTWASDHSLPCHKLTGSMKDEALRAWVLSLNPEYFVVVGWYHMIPATLRQIAPAIGLHASLLPDYSGGAPLVWAMINGEKITGISLFEMGDGVDDGPIYGSAATAISQADTIRSLYSRIEDLGVHLLCEYLPRIAGNAAHPIGQDESKRRFFPQRAPIDGLIDWNQPASKIHDFVRAQTRPYPGAFSEIKGKKTTFWNTRVAEQTPVRTPGAIINSDDRLLVACGDGAVLECIELSQESGPISVRDWLSIYAHEITKGLRFD